MTSFHALSIGQMTEFHRILASAGLTKEDVELLLSDIHRGFGMVWSVRTDALELLELVEKDATHGPVLTAVYKSTGGFKLQRDVTGQEGTHMHR